MPLVQAAAMLKLPAVHSVDISAPPMAMTLKALPVTTPVVTPAAVLARAAFTPM